jgi:hypothetical protein
MGVAGALALTACGSSSDAKDVAKTSGAKGQTHGC